MGHYETIILAYAIQFCSYKHDNSRTSIPDTEFEIIMESDECGGEEVQCYVIPEKKCIEADCKGYMSDITAPLAVTDVLKWSEIEIDEIHKIIAFMKDTFDILPVDIIPTLRHIIIH